MDELKDSQISKELQGLLSDKRQIESELSALPELKLDDAIRNGLAQGKRRTRQRARWRTSMQLGGALVCIFILLTGFIRVSPAFASIMKEIPGFSRFVELIDYDSSLKSALDNEFMQHVGVSAESNGYKATVESIMADRQRLIILYTVEGPGIDQNTDFVDYKLDNANGDPLEAGIRSSYYYQDPEDMKDGKLYDYLDVMLGSNQEMPEQIMFALKPGEEWLELPFSIDHEKFAHMKEQIDLNKTFEIAGQSFTINDILITPLQVTVHFESKTNHEIRANSFINMVLEDEQGRRYTSDGGFGTLDDGLFERNFQSGFFAKPKELTLRIEGLHLSEKGKTFVVNTDTMETLKSPLSNIRLVHAEEKEDHYEIKIEMQGLDNISSTVGYTFFEHKGSFRDAAGNSYDILDRSGTQMEWRSGEENVANYYYNIPKADYVQPLTFDVDQYPGYVEESISIRIK